MAQQEPPTYTTAELQVGVIGVGGNDITIFTLTKEESVVYCNSNVPSQKCYVHHDASDQGMNRIVVTGPIECNKLGFFMNECGDTSKKNAYCNNVTIVDGALSMKKGLYKLSIPVQSQGVTTEKGYVYYDNRDSRFISAALAQCSLLCYQVFKNDLNIRYDDDRRIIEYKFHQEPFLRINSGDLLTIEGLNGNETPCYENYLVRYFPHLTSVTRGEYDNPVLNWDPPYGEGRPPFESYIIQRSIDKGPFFDIDYLFTESESSYTDASVWWDPNNAGKIEINYRIIASYAQGQENYHYSNRKSIEVTNEFPMKRGHLIQEITEGITINPNPAKGCINIRSEIKGILSSVEVMDIMGNTISVEKSSGNGPVDVFSLDIQSISNGVYIVVVKAGQKIYTKKFLVVK